MESLLNKQLQNPKKHDVIIRIAPNPQPGLRLVLKVHNYLPNEKGPGNKCGRVL
jgi:hypothetical protein